MTRAARPAAPAPNAWRDIDATTLQRLAQAAADIVLLLDGQGQVIDVLINDRELQRAVARDWRGKAWVDTVTIESRDKVAACLRDALAQPAVAHEWRHLNHPLRGGPDLPVVYTVAPIAVDARSAARTRLIAFGRDLRSTMTLQMRLVEAQQAVERDHWRFREADTRYRKLFQTSGEATLLVDAGTLKLVEANPAAMTLIGGTEPALQGAVLVELFAPSAAQSVQDAVASARSVGRHEPLVVPLTRGGATVAVHVLYLRQEPVALLLVRLLPQAPAALRSAMARDGDRTNDRTSERGNGRNHEPAGLAPPAAMWAAFLRGASDALVFTDSQGRIVAVNRAFAQLTQLSSEDQAVGQPLDRWLGRPGVEVGVLIANLRQGGPVGLYATQLRGDFGAHTEVEISASRLEDGGGASFAFALRDIGRRLGPHPPSSAATRRELAPDVRELASLVGRVPLKQIVTETSDLIEQMSIEAALQMARDNRVLAAQLLGLSRQSLYVKLRRYGLGDLPTES